MDKSEIKLTTDHRGGKQPFRWAVGIEGSIIPHLGIDQLEWTQHDRFWRDDLTLAARNLGCRWLRYSLAWNRIERDPGVFAWSWVDEKLELAQELGLKLILDLVHFGVPEWLPGAFGDIEFPEAMERFAYAFGSRYAGHPVVPTICPINEPLTTAYFSGDAGLWPPHGKGLASYMRILTNLAQGFCRSTRVLRETMPGIEIILCDSLEVAVTNEPDSSEKTSPHLIESLGIDVERRMQRRHIVMDLIMGRVTENHPLREWLMSHGFISSDFDWLSRNKQQIDIIGLDYYDHTEVELLTSPEGYFRQRTNPNPVGFYRAAQAYWHRYHLPFMITETSAVGSIDRRMNWLQTCVDDVRKLRADGFPCIGYTWWPLFDHLDWDGAMLHQTGHIHPVGIYSLQRQPDGELIRMPTELTDAYRTLICGGDSSVGPLNLARFSTNKNRPEEPATPSVLGPIEIQSWPLVIHSNHGWDGPWQRQHHMAAELQRRHPVLFIERSWSQNHLSPSYSLSTSAQFSNLLLLRLSLPHRLSADEVVAAKELRTSIHHVLNTEKEGGQFENAIHLVYDANFFSVIAPEFRQQAVVYDFTTQSWRSTDRSTEESALLESANLVVTRTRGDFAATHTPRDRCMIPDGVDTKLFAGSHRFRTRIPYDISFIGRPIIGFFGTIDERLDIDLIMSIVDQNRYSVLGIGPVAGAVTPESLPRRENLFWIGPRPYHLLGNYAKAVDTWILPYKTDLPYYLPKKLPEYLITGRPVISTALPEVEACYGDSVQIARSREAFVELCLNSLDQQTQTDRCGIIRKIARHPWRRMAEEMERRIDPLCRCLELNSRSQHSTLNLTKENSVPNSR
jgi:beta-glucosidase/6-phospho-beta-glucosidase/beta-galactosidase